MRQQQTVSAYLFLFFFFLNFTSLCAIHNGSRYFPFLERPENYLLRKPYLHVAGFYASADTAFKRGGKNGGIPELWGNYDLQDVIRSLQVVRAGQGQPFVNPIVTETGSTEFANPSIPLKFSVSSRVHSQGIILNYEHNLNYQGLSVGVWLPIIDVTAVTRYNFLSSDFMAALSRPLTFNELARLTILMDKIRRSTHDLIGFTQNQWQKTGFGDLDIHLRGNNFFDHKLLMRSINIDTQVGLIIPTGALSQNDNPSSVSFMGDGHVGLYVDVVPEFELKQDLKVGFMFSSLYQFKNERTVRIPVYKEPAIYSSLVGKLEVDPGWTLKLSPYIIFENFTDGLHFQARYTYLRHAIDRYADVRLDKAIPSFLTLMPGQLTDTTTLAQSDIDQNSAQKQDLSKWRSHYISLQVMYNSKDALHNLSMDPNAYILYDWPIGGNGISKTHQVTVGVELHF